MTSNERGLTQLDVSSCAFGLGETSIEELIFEQACGCWVYPRLSAAVTTSSMHAGGYEVEKESVNVPN